MRHAALSGPHWAVSYFMERLSPGRLLLPLCVAFGCVWAVLATPFGAQVVGARALLPAVGTFVLLLAQLRLVDDLDDLEGDHPGSSREQAEQRAALRFRFKASLALIGAALLLLNRNNGRALAVVGVASLLAYTGAFVIKRYCPPTAAFLALAFVVFEGAPAAILAYAYFSSGARGGAALALAVTACFWIGYEFWKFSRKAHQQAEQPYLLTRGGVRLALSALLVAGTAINCAFAQLVRLGALGTVYLTCLPLVLLCWMNARWRHDTTSASGGRWAGMTYLMLVELGVLVALTASRVTPTAGK